MDERDFKRAVAQVLEQLPGEFRQQLKNVAIVIEKRPTRRQLRAMGLDPKRDTLYGLYEGTPLPERSALFPPLLPDKITIFSEPLSRDFRDRQAVHAQIRQTLIHEIAHYFGIDEMEIGQLGY